MSQLRLYTFVNFYLSSIQAGIQSTHVLGEMFMKYTLTREADRLYDWAANHKTMVVLNGGANADLIDKFTFLEQMAEKLSFPAPFASFHEDQQSLGGIMTCIGIVLPEKIYDAVDHREATQILGLTDTLEGYFYIKDGIIMNFYLADTPEGQLINMIKSCPLAR